MFGKRGNAADEVPRARPERAGAPTPAAPEAPKRAPPSGGAPSAPKPQAAASAARPQTGASAPKAQPAASAAKPAAGAAKPQAAASAARAAPANAPQPVAPASRAGGGATFAIDNRSDEYYHVKTMIFSALIDTIDLAQLGQLDVDSAREEIRDIVNEIITIKN